MIPKMETPIEIRSILEISEMLTVEDLQREVWGVPDIEVVPASHLIAAVEAGGVLLGAFVDKSMVGFAYGFVSLEKGQMAHHSHMLAVKPEYRNLNLGEKLKLAQRQFVMDQGITLMSWTFDPLQSLNAYFNFNKLGVIADRYIVNFYGWEAASFLHQNGTDRFWVSWNLDSERVKNRIEKKIAADDLLNVKRIVQLDENDSPQLVNLIGNDPQIAIEIPSNINEIQSQNPELAIQWREATRAAFLEALAENFIVKEFFRGQRGEQKFGIYLLEREKTN
ncbi:MAG: hypothetical protein K1X72_28185 [Pyrinomonadaceae bacterium]|nr:hypothetical protein [Pyrinomonadaceae bacterium]